MKLNILSQNHIFHTGHFDIVDFEIEKDDEVHKHTNVIMSDSVFVLPITEEREIYLVSQYRYLLGVDKLEMVAGVVEPGEDPLRAAERELKEETGLSAKKITKIATLEKGASFVKGTLHVYVAQDLQEGEQSQDFFEDIQILKLSLSDAINKIETGEIDTTGAVSSILLVDRLLREGKI